MLCLLACWIAWRKCSFWSLLQVQITCASTFLLWLKRISYFAEKIRLMVNSLSLLVSRTAFGLWKTSGSAQAVSKSWRTLRLLNRFIALHILLFEDIEYIKSLLPANCNPDFFQYLAQLDCRRMKIEAVPEGIPQWLPPLHNSDRVTSGSVVFPKVPLMTVEGPLAICQLMETTFLNLINYASLIATNAARFRQVVLVLNVWKKVSMSTK